MPYRRCAYVSGQSPAADVFHSTGDNNPASAGRFQCSSLLSRQSPDRNALSFQYDSPDSTLGILLDGGA